MCSLRRSLVTQEYDLDQKLRAHDRMLKITSAIVQKSQLDKRHIMSNLLTSSARSLQGNLRPRSYYTNLATLGPYFKPSVWDFPVKNLTSVNKGYVKNTDVAELNWPFNTRQLKSIYRLIKQFGNENSGFYWVEYFVRDEN